MTKQVTLRSSLWEPHKTRHQGSCFSTPTWGGQRVFSGHVLSLLAPGQGSQTPGMLTPWLDLPGTRDQIATWSKLTQLDLERLGTTATAEEITDTAVTQP